MALSLNDIKAKKDDGVEKSKESKERVLRPWETFDQMGLQTRTSQAKEAVKRAKKIVERNNSIVNGLREGVVDCSVIRDLDDSVEQRESLFQEGDIEMIPQMAKVKKNRNIFSLIRDVLGSKQL